MNESRQVLQEQPDFAQSLLREPNTPIIRKSRGTSTQVGLQTQQKMKKILLGKKAMRQVIVVVLVFLNTNLT